MNNDLDQSHFLDLIGPKFIELNRNLNWADTIDEWLPAIENMYQLLNTLEMILKDKDSFDETSMSKESFARIFSLLMTVLAEAGQYRLETFVPNPDKEDDFSRMQIITKNILPAMSNLRNHVATIVKNYLAQPIFHSVANHIQNEIYPLLDNMDSDAAPDRFMPFRVIQVGNIVERLYGFSHRTKEPFLIGTDTEPGLLQHIYNFKYLRFGTSGVRGRWQQDFTETRAKQVIQAICDFLKNEGLPNYLKGENLTNRRIVIGYDSRKNASIVAEWAAQVCLANGFKVDLAFRDTPTPALVYYLTDYLGTEEVAGLINCTASHNPPEWQGIKFNPRQGWPAPTNLTDFIAARINELQIVQRPVQVKDMNAAYDHGEIRGFDPIDTYVKWILNSGRGNQRIPIDQENIRAFFSNSKIVIDEMHGAGRGYLTRILGEIGVRHTVLHPERDPNIPGLEYANPEEPFINPLKEYVQSSEAVLGLGMDTDADRFGVVDGGGVYFRPNQILPMLVRYLGIDRGIKGRVIATQTGSPLIEVLAKFIPGNDRNNPEDNVIPAYIDHPFYRLRIGNNKDRIYHYTFMVPVGIKYIEEQRRTNNRYETQKNLPDDWRETILIGGEESSGLTTKGHVTDKDGIWANLLIMDMLAYYGTRTEKPLTSISAIWEDTCSLPDCWQSFGGREHQSSNSGRNDVDAVLEIKEELINFFLDNFTPSKENTFLGLKVVFAGGVRYDLVELQLQDTSGDARHYLRIRASGTEPINRIYVESANKELAQLLMNAVLQKLEEFTIFHILNVKSDWQLIDTLIYTKYSQHIQKSVTKVLKAKDWPLNELIQKLSVLLKSDYLEGRNKRMGANWINELMKLN